MKPTMGIVLLALLGGCSAFDQNSDMPPQYYRVPGPAQTTWKENGRYKTGPYPDQYASAAPMDTPGSRQSPPSQSDTFADQSTITQTSSSATTLPATLASPAVAPASLTGAATVADTTESPGSLPPQDRVSEQKQTADFGDFPDDDRSANAAAEPSDAEAPKPIATEITKTAEIAEGVLPAKGKNDAVFPAKAATKDLEPVKQTSESKVLPAPEASNFGSEEEAAGEMEESSTPYHPSTSDAVAPAKKSTGVPGVLVLDHQPKSLAPPAVRMVNSQRITINYEVKDIGPSGVSGVELWCTHDGKSWKKRDVSRQARPPYVVEVQEEGLYGFTLLARNGIGLGAEAPKPGDLPQIWVEVDMTSPVVQLTGVNANCSGHKQNVIIHWKATDKNLGPRPITLSYAQTEEGPWQVIAAKVPNTGRYVWALPPETPARFLVRVEATDLVGNVGASQTPKPVLMDRSQPVVNILNVDAESK
jgi:hypothetical protein